MPETKSVVVLISGGGSNLQALIDCSESLGYHISAVISNKAGVYGLERAEHAGIPAETIPHTGYDDRNEFDQALVQQIDEYKPDLVVLAGFMRILGKEFVRHYLGRLLNIHPSLLPKYPGMHTHARALEAGDKQHGVSVHFVTEELDGGPVIAQARVNVLDGDTPETLASRVLEKEHLLYPQVVGWFCSGRLCMNNGRAQLDGQSLPATGLDFNG